MNLNFFANSIIIYTHFFGWHFFRSPWDLVSKNFFQEKVKLLVSPKNDFHKGSSYSCRCEKGSRLRDFPSSTCCETRRRFKTENVHWHTAQKLLTRDHELSKQFGKTGVRVSLEKFHIVGFGFQYLKPLGFRGVNPRGTGLSIFFNISSSSSSSKHSMKVVVFNTVEFSVLR